MACYHPLNAISLGKTINGKQNLKIIPSEKAAKIPKENLVKLPCGQCIGCRLDYSRQWANRCMMELQYHDSSYFVTLTYDDSHVNRVIPDCMVDKYTGEVIDEKYNLTLRKRDFQLFMKRLRKRFSDQKIRYFAAGEYGSKTMRPHFHAIIFGLKLDDLQFYKNSPLGYSYYTSPSLSAVWSDVDGNPIGHAVVGEVSWDTCAYTARYIMKKATGLSANFYKENGIEPEFTLMSRKPGIARQYYEDHPDIYKNEFINIKTEKGGLKFRPPRYFDLLYDLDDHEDMQRIKDNRKKIATYAQEIKLQKCTYNETQLLEVEERNKQAKIKSLRRDIL